MTKQCFKTTQNSLAFKNIHFTLQVAIEIYFLLATFCFMKKAFRLLL